MLVGYSSSSEEEEGETETTQSEGFDQKWQKEDDGSDDLPPKKKIKTDEPASKKRLPLPGCLLTMFPDEMDPQTEDSSLHGGRVRSFKHERGNWATYVYFPYHPEDEFEEFLEELLSTARARGVGLTPQEEFHLSLSQTVVLRHHWIQPFIQSLKESLTCCRRFVCTAGRLKVYSNAERTRTFLGMEVSSGNTQLLDLVHIVDKTMTEFRLETFYEDPSFHVSLAWCVGDQTEKLKRCIQELQTLVERREDGPLLLRLDCSELRCRTGNKTFRFPLET